ncbi:MAG: family 10 glycosylhydrolase [Ruminococcus sp.]|nr:family 10 glycosylhydrolase [Ruminococcus sp.]
MRLFRIISIAAALCLCSCNSLTENSESSGSSTADLTGMNESVKPELSESAESDDYEPLNYTNQIGTWYPYMDYAEYMQGKSADEFRAAVCEMFTQAKSQSINTVYVHVRANGDAYYDSSVFPKGTYLDGDYDPLQIMLEEAHKLELSFHAWINPLRCQTTEQMESLSDDFIVKQWAESNTGTFVNIVNGRYYLNPAYEEVIDLICRGVDEIVRNYDVDGIHIDDYFYPTTSEDFDKAAFEASGASDLSEWRIANCNRFVHAMYESVKRVDSDILFGISPQGNIDADYSTLYADVRLWGSCVGSCDYLVPQLYYGFENETCPFAETLAEWENLVTCDSVSLIIGLAAYKLGAEDKWAGAAGELEWVENPDIIQQQIELVEQSSADGYALYY